MTLFSLGVLLMAAGAAPAAAIPSPGTEAGRSVDDLAPFAPPWDDAAPSPTDVSGWLPKPAGRSGHVRVSEDGHLQAGDARIRFLGVNVCCGACFPTEEAASAISGRMAKFGINCVRFHHMDNNTFPNGIRARNAPDTRSLDDEALDRLDWFIAQLKQHGVYADLNLLVSRPFRAADGLPKEIEQLAWKEQQSIGFFFAPLMELQKEYARQLLTHRNPYTRATYAEEPAVAFVEIVNEAGLLHSWLGGRLDALPPVFLRDLQRQWNAWLLQRHGDTAALSRAWGVRQEPLAQEMLRNGRFVNGLAGWNVERHEAARAEASAIAQSDAGTPAIRIDVTQPGTAGWHVQCNQGGLKLEAGRPYTLALRARAEKACTIRVAALQAHAPWDSLGFSAPAELTTQWKEFRWTFAPARGDENARVDLTDLARLANTYWFADVSLKPGGMIGLQKDERLEDASMPVFPHVRFGDRTEEAQKDWMQFLWETERDYWRAMRDFLKHDLGVQALLIGTIVGCSTPNLMAELDVVDSHGYWQHPEFPGRPWDPQNWSVENLSMVNEAGGVPAGLALRRVRGRPFACTEYNHPAPNTYSAEAPLLLAAVAGFQDWDAVFLFAYSHRTDNWDTRRIPPFFDIDQHPVKMANLPVAAALFLRGDMAPAKEEIAVPLNAADERDLLRRVARPWQLVHAGSLGLPAYTALQHRVSLDLAAPPHKEFIPPRPATQPKSFLSDTGELSWDLSSPDKGIVLLNTKRTRAVIGFGEGRDFRLGDVELSMGRTRQGWSTLALTLMEGDSFAGPCRVLITATGYAENTDMGWKSAKKDTVGRDWGKAPSLVEVVPATIMLPAPAAKVAVWALDERGQRAAQVLVEPRDGQSLFRIGSPATTLWYEVTIR